MSRTVTKTPINLRFAMIQNGTPIPYKFYLESDGAILPGGRKVTFSQLEQWARDFCLGIPQIINEVR